jgi:hypothetical protein
VAGQLRECAVHQRSPNLVPLRVPCADHSVEDSRRSRTREIVVGTEGLEERLLLAADVFVDDHAHSTPLQVLDVAEYLGIDRVIEGRQITVGGRFPVFPIVFAPHGGRCDAPLAGKGTERDPGAVVEVLKDGRMCRDRGQA